MLDLQELAELFEAHKADAQQPIKSFEIGGEPFDFDQQAAVMGVVNLSPGSWYRESVCLSPESAIQRGFVLFAQGAHIIDVGAESTLADAERVPAAFAENFEFLGARMISPHGLAKKLDALNLRRTGAAMCAVDPAVRAPTQAIDHGVRILQPKSS